MLEVFVFGVFVAYVKLGDLVTIGLATGVYALLALPFGLVWMDSALDREAVWERLYQPAPCTGPSSLPGAVACETCNLVSVPEPNGPRCPRCDSPDQYGDACERCGSTYDPRELKDPRCVLCGRPPVPRESEHYYVTLKPMEKRLREWV